MVAAQLPVAFRCVEISSSRVGNGGLVRLRPLSSEPLTTTWRSAKSANRWVKAVEKVRYAIFRSPPTRNKIRFSSNSALSRNRSGSTRASGIGVVSQPFALTVGLSSSPQAHFHRSSHSANTVMASSGAPRATSKVSQSYDDVWLEIIYTLVPVIYETGLTNCLLTARTNKVRR